MRILIAGIGNIFLGDDAFGSQLARRLAACSLPGEVKVVDFGIRGLDLTYALLDGYDCTILLDATSRGGSPGDLYVIECDPDSLEEGGEMDPHAMNPVRILQLARTLGADLRKILLVGCEPLTLQPEPDAFRLSPAVAGSMDAATALVESLVAKILNENASLNENAPRKTEIKEMTL